MEHPQPIGNKEVTGVPTEEPSVWARTILRRNGLMCSDAQIAQLDRFTQLVIEWNKRVNLISRRDVDNLWEGHVLHSLSLLFKFRIGEKKSLLDLGTGGGFPGIPLKILLPSVEVILMDATKKKVVAVQSMIQELGLTGAEAVWGRAEDLSTEKRFAGRYHHVLARGVASLRELIQYARPYARGETPAAEKDPPVKGSLRLLPDKTLIAYKGGNLEEEVRQARGLGASVEIIDLAYEGAVRQGLEKKLVVVTL